MAHCVVTTINKPTKAIEVLYEKFGSKLIIVGDEKTPEGWSYKDADYILDLPPEKGNYSGYAPRNSYARKNLGYLKAIWSNPNAIFDTDDDNTPTEVFKERASTVLAKEGIESGWFNVYKIFSDAYMWCRGFSLKHLNENASLGEQKFVTSSIQQGLADKEPDVDAIWRLAFQKEVRFKDAGSVYLHPFSWCPFNSQVTWWFPKAFALMYLPVTASFRMCDIWRSFIAQRCLWAMGEGVTFHSPAEVYQDRNPHDLLKDFADEIDGYLGNDIIVETLSKLELKSGEENVCSNLLTCYNALFEINVFPYNEIRSVEKWIKDYENITANLG